MTNKTFQFNFRLYGITDQQAVDLLAQISDWAVANEAGMSAGYNIVNPENVNMAAVRVAVP